MYGWTYIHRSIHYIYVWINIFAVCTLLENKGLLLPFLHKIMFRSFSLVSIRHAFVCFRTLPLRLIGCLICCACFCTVSFSLILSWTKWSCGWFLSRTPANVYMCFFVCVCRCVNRRKEEEGTLLSHGIAGLIAGH